MFTIDVSKYLYYNYSIKISEILKHERGKKGGKFAQRDKFVLSGGICAGDMVVCIKFGKV